QLHHENNIFTRLEVMDFNSVYFPNHSSEEDLSLHVTACPFHRHGRMTRHTSVPAITSAVMSSVIINDSSNNRAQGGENFSPRK
ncbi:hypothetical protein L9F63_016914, partial [Diploptera punctata]